MSIFRARPRTQPLIFDGTPIGRLRGYSLMAKKTFSGKISDLPTIVGNSSVAVVLSVCVNRTVWNAGILLAFNTAVLFGRAHETLPRCLRDSLGCRNCFTNTDFSPYLLTYLLTTLTKRYLCLGFHL